MERRVCQFQTVSTKGFTPKQCAERVPSALRNEVIKLARWIFQSQEVDPLFEFARASFRLPMTATFAQTVNGVQQLHQRSVCLLQTFSELELRGSSQVELRRCLRREEPCQPIFQE